VRIGVISGKVPRLKQKGSGRRREKPCIIVMTSRRFSLPGAIFNTHCKIHSTLPLFEIHGKVSAAADEE
jgi:hypothetical protein